MLQSPIPQKNLNLWVKAHWRTNYLPTKKLYGIMFNSLCEAKLFCLCPGSTKFRTGTSPLNDVNRVKIYGRTPVPVASWGGPSVHGCCPVGPCEETSTSSVFTEKMIYTFLSVSIEMTWAFRRLLRRDDKMTR